MKRLREMEDPRNGWYEISPADAMELLNGEALKNRPLSRTQVQFIARAINQGEFIANGESIVLDNAGNLADGQHRLRAVIVANKPIMSFVVFNAKRFGATFFDSIDQGKRRSAADRMALEGCKHAILATSVARLIECYERNVSYTGYTHSTISTYRKTYERNSDEIQSAIASVNSKNKHIARLIPTSRLTFCYMMARRVDAKLADRWLDALCFGENMSADNPAMVLRRQLQNETLRSGGGLRRITTDAFMAFMIRSWIGFRHGRKLQNLRWAVGEALPRFDSDK